VRGKPLQPAGLRCAQSKLRGRWGAMARDCGVENGVAFPLEDSLPGVPSPQPSPRGRGGYPSGGRVHRSRWIRNQLPPRHPLAPDYPLSLRGRAIRAGFGAIGPGGFARSWRHAIRLRRTTSLPPGEGWGEGKAAPACWASLRSVQATRPMGRHGQGLWRGKRGGFFHREDSLPGVPSPQPSPRGRGGYPSGVRGHRSSRVRDQLPPRHPLAPDYPLSLRGRAIRAGFGSIGPGGFAINCRHAIRLRRTTPFPLGEGLG